MNTAPVWILLFVFIYGLVHSILAALRTKALARQWIGQAVDRWYRVFFNIFATVTLIPVLALPILLPDNILYKVSPPWIYFTVFIQVGAVVVLGLALLQTDPFTFIGFRQLLQQKRDRTTDQLVTGGFYRWVRHPLYTAGLAFIWFSPVMTINLLALDVGLTAYTIIGAIYEERKLLKKFGEAYRTYQAHTPMLIPGPRLKK